MLFEQSLESLEISQLAALNEDASIFDALNTLKDSKYGAIGIKSCNELLGIVSEKDLLLRSSIDDYPNWKDTPVTTIMSSKVFSLNATDSLAQAISMLARMGFRHVPLRKADQSWGVISARDVLDLVIEQYQEICSRFGTLVDWETEVGHIHEEDYVFHGQKDSLETGSLLFATMKEVGGSDILKVDQALPLGELWRGLKASHLNVATVSKWSTQILGIITERDFVYKVFGHDRDIFDQPVSSIMTENPHMMLVKHHMIYALNNMATYRYRNILVVDEDKQPLKVAELVDFLRFFRRVMQDCGYPIA